MTLLLSHRRLLIAITVLALVTTVWGRWRSSNDRG